MTFIPTGPFAAKFNGIVETTVPREGGITFVFFDPESRSVQRHEVSPVHTHMVEPMPSAQRIPNVQTYAPQTAVSGGLTTSQPIDARQSTPEKMNPTVQASAIRSYAAALQEEYSQAMHQAALLESQGQTQRNPPLMLSAPQYQHDRCFLSGQSAQRTFAYPQD